MTKNTSPLPEGPMHQPTSIPSEVAVARRAAIAIIAKEGIQAFAQTREAAQRALVRALETARTPEDVSQSLARFTVEASRDYAGPALSFHDLACALGEPGSVPRQT